MLSETCNNDHSYCGSLSEANAYCKYDSCETWDEWMKRFAIYAEKRKTMRNEAKEELQKMLRLKPMRRIYTGQEAEKRMQRRKVKHAESYRQMIQHETEAQCKRRLYMQRLYSQHYEEKRRLYNLKDSACRNLSKLNSVVKKVAKAEAAETHQLSVMKRRRRELAELIEMELMKKAEDTKDLNGTDTNLYTDVSKISKMVLQFISDRRACSQFVLNNDQSSMEPEEIIPATSQSSDSEMKVVIQSTPKMPDSSTWQQNETDNEGEKRCTNISEMLLPFINDKHVSSQLLLVNDQLAMEAEEIISDINPSSNAEIKMVIQSTQQMPDSLMWQQKEADDERKKCYSSISEMVRQFIGDKRVGNQLVFVKDQPSMKYEEIISDIRSNSDSEMKEVIQCTTQMSYGSTWQQNEADDQREVCYPPRKTYSRQHRRKTILENKDFSTEQVCVKQEEFLESEQGNANKSTYVEPTQRQPNDLELAFLKTSEDTFVPVQVINQTYLDFDDMLEIENV